MTNTQMSKNMIPIQDFAKKHNISQRTAYHLFKVNKLKGKRVDRPITTTRIMKTIMIDEESFFNSVKQS